MIYSNINELTVFADKCEDEGMDISLFRFLCNHHYFWPCLNYYGYESNCSIFYAISTKYGDGFFPSNGNDYFIEIFPYDGKNHIHGNYNYIYERGDGSNYLGNIR